MVNNVKIRSLRPCVISPVINGIRKRFAFNQVREVIYVDRDTADVLLSNIGYVEEVKTTKK